MQARHEAETGQTDIAMQDMRRLFVMINHFCLSPFNNSSGVTLGRIRLANQTLAKVLLYARVSPTQARAFESSLPVIDLKPLAYHDFLIDRITSINGFESSSWPYLLFKDNFPAEKSLLKFRGIVNLITTPLRKLDETRALKWFVISYKRYHIMPFPMQPKYREAQFDELVEEVNKEPWYAIGTKLTPGVLPNSIPEKIETARRERIIALALAAYHTQYHQYPLTLKALETFWGGALPKDLYSEKPFRYRSDGKTFHLYSVGNDRKDDGGKAIKAPYNDDIEWPNNVQYIK